MHFVYMLLTSIVTCKLLLSIKKPPISSGISESCIDFSFNHEVLVYVPDFHSASKVTLPFLFIASVVSIYELAFLNTIFSHYISDYTRPVYIM